MLQHNGSILAQNSDVTTFGGYTIITFNYKKFVIVATFDSYIIIASSYSKFDFVAAFDYYIIIAFCY